MKHELTVQVGADGVLHFQLPLRPEDANKSVRVVVETAESIVPEARRFANREEWLRFLDGIEGKWLGEENDHET